jgi:hypothetical protein
MKTERKGNAAATSLSGKVFTVVNSGGYWRNPTTWQDSQGNSGVPRNNDFAIVGAATVIFEDDGTGLDVGSVSITGGHLYGNSFLAVNGIATISGGSFENGMSLIIRQGAFLELVNSANFTFGADSTGVFGTLLNSGTINVHGSGGLIGVSDFSNHGALNWRTPLTIHPLAGLDPAADLRSIGAQHATNSGLISGSVGLISQDGASLISQDGASAISHDGGSAISHDGGSLVSASGGSIVATGGGNLISQDGAGIVATGGGNIISTNGCGIVATGGGNIVATGGGNIVATGGGNAIQVTGTGTAASRSTHQAAGTATASSGFTQSGGETDLTSCTIFGPVTLDGGILSGSGVITGDLINNGGFIAPGHSAGFIAATGNYTQAANGTLILEAAGGEAGQFDQLQITGAASLNGRLDLRTINGYVPLPDDAFAPLGYASGNGAFSSVSGNTQLTLTPTGAEAVIDPSQPNPGTGQPVNISTRLNVQTGDNVLIAGFIVTGPSGSTKKVLIRGLGPSLAASGISNFLADPFLELHKTRGEVVTNDDWQQTSNADQIPDNLKPSDTHESAIVATLASGDYTAVLKGAHDETGVGLVEVFDLDSASPAQLANLSTRGFVQTGDNVMIGGFIVNGNEPGKILVRALGPSLTGVGVANALSDPILELHDASGTVISNDDWRNTQEAEITATGLAPSQESEAAILMTLPPGNYTAIVLGKNGATGVALIEAYNLQ